MPVTMRILQRFDPRHEKEFMELERQFAQLEVSRPGYPRGNRLQPISGVEPCNTLIWEGVFPDVNSARRALNFFAADAEHEALLKRQLPYFEQVKIEFYENLEF